MNVLTGFKNITTFVFDIDGVLTDGTVLVLREGLQARRMHVKDGFALQMAVKKGYKVFIISGGTAEEVKYRLEKLGLKDIFLAVEDKAALLHSLIKKNKLSWDQVLYMGDDLPDIPLLHLAGLSCCPSDAVNEVKAAVTYISPIPGGWGCVRDVIEKVLRLNGHWQFETDITSR